MSSSTTRKIGPVSVPPIGYGAMGLGTTVYNGAVQPDEERFKVLDAALEQGCTHWDTSDLYGDSEDILGKWFKRTGKRNEIFLATKFAVNAATREIRGDPEYVKQAVAKSLSRLGVDTIDLLYLHRVDVKVPIEITVGAMAEFVKAGKVKYLGISECSADTLRRAHAVHPISAVQVEYSLFALDVEKTGLFETAKELGVTIVAYAPLGRGMLTGNYKSSDDFHEKDFRKTLPRYSKENFPIILALIDVIKTIAVKHNVTPGQIAIAWTLAQRDDIIVIPGTVKVKYLTENNESIKVTLASDEIAQIRKAALATDHAGGRYPHEFAQDTPALPK